MMRISPCMIDYVHLHSCHHLNPESHYGRSHQASPSSFAEMGHTRKQERCECTDQPSEEEGKESAEEKMKETMLKLANETMQTPWADWSKALPEYDAARAHLKQ